MKETVKCFEKNQQHEGLNGELRIDAKFLELMQVQILIMCCAPFLDQNIVITKGRRAVENCERISFSGKRKKCWNEAGE